MQKLEQIYEGKAKKYSKPMIPSCSSWITRMTPPRSTA